MREALEIVLVAFVVIGAVPAVTMGLQFLLVPVHAWRNHYGAAGVALPRVAVVIPAWNEGAVIGASIERLLALDYPRESLRLYVVDDASTDDTPAVVLDWAARHPGRVIHLRREKGGQGKAHTLNHGLVHVLGEPWAQAVLIMDADVIYAPDSLRRMARHLADPQVGAVTAYIREGTRRTAYLNRFVGVEYVLAQLAARRAQNVLGAMACLAGGAQLHARANLEALGGRIDTATLAEDTVTTLLTQIDGRRVVFEPHAVVLAEEPRAIDALWKQRLRWARGNVQVTRRFRRIWFRPRWWGSGEAADGAAGDGGRHRLGSLTFGAIWFSVLLLPVFMVLASVGLVGLYLLESSLLWRAFQWLWISIGLIYLYSMLIGVQLDGPVTRRGWREVILFPGAIAMVVMLSAFFPGLFDERVPALFGLHLTATGERIWVLFTFVWISACMLGAWLCRVVDRALRRSGEGSRGDGVANWLSPCWWASWGTGRSCARSPWTPT